MKTVLLSIVFYFIFFFAQAQKTNLFYSKQHQARAMALFVENVKPVYAKGQTFEDFEKKLIADATNTPEGKALLKRAYQFLVEGTSKQEIESSYIGLEINNAIKFTRKQTMRLSTLEEVILFGGLEVEKALLNQQSKNSGCRWYQLMCLMEQTSS